MKLAFTVCSVSYLGQAKAMADSFVKHNPAYAIKIGVVDKINGRIDLSQFVDYELIEIDSIGILDLDALAAKYNGLELCCLAKPFMASFLLKTYPDVKQLIYTDTDILFFSSITEVEQKLRQNAIFLTPHILSPYPDTHLYPLETSHLNSGLYNAGFWAISRGEITQNFLEWWQKRVVLFGFVNFMDGMFVDQLWLNYVPLFFQKVILSENLGMNVGYWNLHEREIQRVDNKFIVNRGFPLVFFHFSGYNLKAPTKISVHTNRFELTGLPELQPVFELYHQRLLENQHIWYQQLPNLLTTEKTYMKYGVLREYALRIARKLIRTLHG